MTNTIWTCVHVLYCGMFRRMYTHQWLTQGSISIITNWHNTVSPSMIDTRLYECFYSIKVYMQSKCDWLIIVHLVVLGIAKRQTHPWARLWGCFQRVLTEVGRPTLNITGAIMEWGPGLNQKAKANRAPSLSISWLWTQHDHHLTFLLLGRVQHNGLWPQTVRQNNPSLPRVAFARHSSQRVKKVSNAVMWFNWTLTCGILKPSNKCYLLTLSPLLHLTSLWHRNAHL